MILTGKAKEGFDKWRLSDIALDKFGGVYFYELPTELQYTLIIEWLDSVGIYIWTIPSARVETKWTFRIFKDLFSHIKPHAYRYNNRETATKQAIIKANEIYNELNK